MSNDRGGLLLNGVEALTKAGRVGKLIRLLAEPLDVWVLFLLMVAGTLFVLCCTVCLNSHFHWQ